ncbi:MAG: GAF domain-containing protein [Anaerolineales bacterium]|nr:GAF domain-containing protein [Anaerolineales bacterium]MBX3038223.1 GAF domain-containing protein [Anaerolineales bacterium]
MSQNVSFKSRLSRVYETLIQPHPSLTNVEDIRKAELLATITIIVSSLLITGAIVTARSVTVFLVLLTFTVSSYMLSRTTYYQVGAYIFTYSFTALGFYTILNGRASSIDIAVATTVHIGIVISSVLLSRRGFLILVLLATGAAFTSPLYSTLPVQSTDSFVRSGGVVLTIGLILYGINNFRAKLEKEQLAKLTEVNQKLEDLSASQEQNILERTQALKEASEQLQQRATRLQSIAEISQEIVSSITQKPDEVLGRITQIVSKKLGYYHVGIFLLDKDEEYAVLRAANSRGGQKMLARRHQLKVGGAGIVGYATQSGRPRIALDTTTDAVFFNNPDLPETRSEISLPLKYGNKILGALDVQSSQPNAFKDEDVDTLSALANQIAIVVKDIQNAEDIKYGVANRNIKFSQRDTKQGYSFQPDGSIIVTALPQNNPQLEKAIASGETVILSAPSKNSQPTIAVPVKFREQIIGIIHIEASENNRNWTEDEVTLVQAISDRAALALENARLLEDSQRRASKEQAIGEISTKITASTDIEAILRTAVRELGTQISGTQVTVEIGGGKK